MKKTITGLLNITDREWERLLPCATLFFLLMMGWGFGNAGRDAYFVSNAGSGQLPYMYIMNAVLVAVCSAFYSVVADRLSRIGLFNAILIGSACILTSVRSLMCANYVWVPYALYALSEIILTLAILMHFWTLANDLFDPREGKRQFPIIGAMGLIGAATGAFTTKLIVPIIGTENIFLLWAGCLVTCVPLNLYIRKVAESQGIVNARTSAKEDSDAMSLEALATIWKIPLVRSLAYLAGPFWLVSWFVDYQFFVFLESVFTDQDELAGFLGIFNSLASFAGLFLQLVVTRQLLNRFGTGVTMLAHAVIMAIASVSLVVSNAFFASSIRLFGIRGLSSIGTQFADVVVNSSIGESAYQLLFNAFAEQQRGRCRAFLSGAVEQFFTALAGIVLIIFSTAGLSLLSLSIATFLLCLLWVFLVFDVKESYIRTLVPNLNSRNPDLQRLAVTELLRTRDKNSAMILREAIAAPNVEVALFALQIFEEVSTADDRSVLCDLLQSCQPRVQLEILRFLAEYGDDAIAAKVVRLLDNPDPEIVTAALATIAATANDPYFLIEKYLDHYNHAIRGQAIISFIRAKNPEKHERGVALLNLMAVDEHPEARAKAAFIIGECGDQSLIPQLLTLSKDHDEKVLSEVVRASGKIKDERTAECLVCMLKTSSLITEVIESIINLGSVAVNPICQQLREPKVDPDLKCSMLECLGQAGDVAAVPIIVSLLGDEHASLQFESTAITALTCIQSKLDRHGKNVGVDHNFSLITDKRNRKDIKKSYLANIRKMRDTETSIKRLRMIQSDPVIGFLIDELNRTLARREKLALTYLELTADRLTIQTASVNLKSANLRQRAEALEVLDGSCSEARPFVELLELRDLADLSARELDEIDTEQIFKELLFGHFDPWIQAWAVYAMQTLKFRELSSMLSELLKVYDVDRKTATYSHALLASLRSRGVVSRPILKYNVYLALEEFEIKRFDGNKREELDRMALNMQKILFLRSVPLFIHVEGEDLQYISEITTRVAFKGGDTIFEENDDGDALYIIESGIVKVVTSNAEVVLAILRQRDCFGEMAILDKRPRSATVVVQSDCELLRISRDDFQGLLLARPQIALSLFRTLSIRLRTTLSLLDDNKRRQVHQQTKIYETTI